MFNDFTPEESVKYTDLEAEMRDITVDMTPEE